MNFNKRCYLIKKLAQCLFTIDVLQNRSTKIKRLAISRLPTIRKIFCMNSIIQDMRFTLFIVKSYHHVDAMKTASRYKVTRHLFIFGYIASMAISTLLQIIPIHLITILISTLIVKSNG